MKTRIFLKYLLSLVRLHVFECTYSHTQQEDRLSSLKLSWVNGEYDVMNSALRTWSPQKSHVMPLCELSRPRKNLFQKLLKCSTGFIWVLSGEMETCSCSQLRLKACDTNSFLQCSKTEFIGDHQTKQKPKVGIFSSWRTCFSQLHNVLIFVVNWSFESFT